MANITRMRTRTTGDRTEILVLVKHPKQPASQDGESMPVWFIEQMTFFHNGRTVAIAEFGPNVAENPLMGVSVTGAKAGDGVAVRWIDNRGGNGGSETDVR